MRIIDGFRLRNVMGQAAIVGEGVAQAGFNKLILLNETAVYLWEQVLDREFDVGLLCSLLMEKYGISEDMARKDAAAIAAKWVDAGLVK